MLHEREWHRKGLNLSVVHALLKTRETAKCGSMVTTRGGVEDTKLEAKAKDSPSEDRPSRGRGLECSRLKPRTKDTGASVFQKKKSLQQKFLGDLQTRKTKKVFANFPRGFWRFPT